MLRVQLLADDDYCERFAAYLASQSAIELVTSSPEIIFDGSFLDTKTKIAALSAIASRVPIVTNTLTVTATTVRSLLGDSVEVFGMPIFPNYFDRQKSVEYSLPLGAAYAPEAATQFLMALGKSSEQIGDSVAGIFPRALAMIVNEAAFAVQESVATPEDIDTAMKLGTNYPKGPLAWCDEIGAKAIVAVLDALATEYEPERYRVASLLRRHAEVGMKFLS